MTLSELLLIFFVACVVFGPSKLPMLATHLGKLVRKLTFFKEQASTFWHNQLNEWQLQENIRKAKEAEEKNKD